jgi:hypothetical protein
MGSRLGLSSILYNLYGMKESAVGSRSPGGSPERIPARNGQRPSPHDRGGIHLL